VLQGEEIDYGLAGALNYGMEQINSDFVLIVEDDSYFSIPTEKRFLIIWQFVSNHTGKDTLYLAEYVESNHSTDNLVIQYDKLLGSNSGLLISKELWKSVKFKEELFMDRVDIDFQARAKKTRVKNLNNHSEIYKSIVYRKKRKNTYPSRL
jgi:GT2 family glycosyltransferase